MSEYTGPELEGEEVALLDMLRDTEGPSSAQEDRMLARLRAQIEVEAEVRGTAADTFAQQEEQPTAPQASAPRPWRTATVGVLAFAAGVALTWGLRDDAPAPPADPAAVAEVANAGAHGHAPNEGARAPAPSRVPHSPFAPGGHDGVDASDDSSATPMPRSLIEAAEHDPQGAATHMAERAAKADQGDATPSSATSASGDPNGTASAPAEDGTPQDRRPHTSPSPGRGEPSRSGSEAGSGTPAPVTPVPSAVGPVELVGGAPSAMGRPYVPSAGGSAPAPTAPGSSPGPTSEPAKPEPLSPEPDSPPEPEEPEPEELEPTGGDEACLNAHLVCIESADLMCSYDGDDCERFFGFCDFAMEVCLGGGEPPPDYPGPDPDEPPDEQGPCAAQLEMCLNEMENICNESGDTPEECLDFEWQCHDEHAACEGYDPPPPPSEW